MKPFPPKEEAENILAISHVLLFQRRALRFQPIRCKVCWTRRIVPRACRAKHFGPQTQLHQISLNCPNQVCEVKVCPVKNKLSSPNFFQVHQTPRTRFMKQKYVQLRMGFRMVGKKPCIIMIQSLVSCKLGKNQEANCCVNIQTDCLSCNVRT